MTSAWRFFELFLLLQSSSVTGPTPMLSPAALMTGVTLNNMEITLFPCRGKAQRLRGTLAQLQTPDLEVISPDLELDTWVSP